MARFPCSGLDASCTMAEGALYSYLNIYIYIYIHMYVDVYICTYACAYMYIHTCVSHIYIYTHIYIYVCNTCFSVCEQALEALELPMAHVAGTRSQVMSMPYPEGPDTSMALKTRGLGDPKRAQGLSL